MQSSPGLRGGRDSNPRGTVLETVRHNQRSTPGANLAGLVRGLRLRGGPQPHLDQAWLVVPGRTVQHCSGRKMVPGSWKASCRDEVATGSALALFSSAYLVVVTKGSVRPDGRDGNRFLGTAGWLAVTAPVSYARPRGAIVRRSAPLAPFLPLARPRREERGRRRNRLPSHDEHAAMSRGKHRAPSWWGRQPFPTRGLVLVAVAAFLVLVLAVVTTSRAEEAPPPLTAPTVSAPPSSMPRATRP